jgi:hypothetical protein
MRLCHVLLCVSAMEEYHKSIRSDIQEQWRKARAVLVVFEDETKIQAFSYYLENQPLAHPLPTIRILHAGLTNQEREGIISQATLSGTITLTTPDFARGSAPRREMQRERYTCTMNTIPRLISSCFELCVVCFSFYRGPSQL